MRRLVIVAAGTGGHVMPGLAVADAMRERGWAVSWLGTRAGMERALVERAGIEFDAVQFSSLRGKGPGALLAGGFRLLRAMLQSGRVLRRRAPDLMFTTGGYIAVPAGAAAACLSVPFAFLNADAAPQLSMRILRRIAASVLCGFDGVALRLAGAKGRLSGAPVRPGIAALEAPAQRYGQRRGRLRLLVVGGSLGAQVLNEAVPAALALIGADRRPEVAHQCGAGHEAATRRAYAEAGVAADVMPFIDDMAAQYAQADLVLCRAGAITVSELCAAGVAAVLVPLVVSTTAHQRSNAEFLAAHGAALHLPQSQLAPATLARLLQELTREQLAAIAQRARSLAAPDATATVASELERIAGQA
jgi:UDP-N-acetylglucosamine--N-acetylmuramyl-(pentapeptide) pyrophosphoryl-undecaprenol N-acetylglucosamine transferase